VNAPPGGDDGEAGFDPATLLSQVTTLQQQLSAAQQAAAAETVEGSAGGGKIRVTVSGTGEVSGVRIDPSVVDPAEVDLLEDLVLAAVRDGLARASRLSQERLGGLLGAVGGSGDPEPPSA